VHRCCFHSPWQLNSTFTLISDNTPRISPIFNLNHRQAIGRVSSTLGPAHLFYLQRILPPPIAMAAPEGAAEPFPAVVEDNAPSAPASPRAPGSDAPTGDVKDRKNSSSSLSYRLRRVSQSFGESSLPEGFTAATGDIASSIFSGRIPAVSDTTSPLRAQRSPTSGTVPKSTLSSAQVAEQRASAEHGTGALLGHDGAAPPAAAPFANGYHFPPSRSFGESAKTGAIAFWKYFLTPLGFCVTIYGLNVVAWGGMLFLLLCNACEDFPCLSLYYRILDMHG
jgi:hypothetical protein